MVLYKRSETTVRLQGALEARIEDARRAAIALAPLHMIAMCLAFRACVIPCGSTDALASQLSSALAAKYSIATPAADIQAGGAPSSAPVPAAACLADWE